MDDFCSFWFGNLEAVRFFVCADYKVQFGRTIDVNVSFVVSSHDSVVWSRLLRHHRSDEWLSKICYVKWTFFFVNCFHIQVIFMTHHDFIGLLQKSLVPLHLSVDLIEFLSGSNQIFLCQHYVAFQDWLQCQLFRQEGREQWSFVFSANLFKPHKWVVDYVYFELLQFFYRHYTQVVILQKLSDSVSNVTNFDFQLLPSQFIQIIHCLNIHWLRLPN